MLRRVEDYHCSFCGKRRGEVRKLISGPRVFICDQCVMLCVDILQKEKAAAPGGAQPDEKKAPPNLTCTFCGKSHRAVEQLIAGPTVYICNECVGLCVDIIQQKIAKENAPK